MAENSAGEKCSAEAAVEGSDFSERMISYSQNSEDVLLRRLYPEKTDGYYIDVGAHHPLHDSVTRYFYDRGWHGINIEPIPDMYQRLSQERTRDINLNVGLSNSDGISIFYESVTHPALSTFVEANTQHHIEQGEKFRERTVPLTTLAKICAEHAVSKIDFLSIDVEGFERQVLEGADFERWRPRAILIESTYPNSRRPTHRLWEDLLLNADYSFAFFDGLNRFYVRSEDASLCERLAVPANVFDNFIPYRYYSWSRELEVHRKEIQVHRENWRAIGRLSRAWRAFRAPLPETRD